MAERIYEFNWDIIGDLQEGRPNLGDQVNLILYRVMQQMFRKTAVQRFGQEKAAQFFFEAGRIGGRFFFERFLQDYKGKPVGEFTAELCRIVKEFGFGILNIEEKGDCIHLTTANDLAALGIAAIGSAFSEYEEGFAAGVFAKYTENVHPAVSFTTVNTWQDGQANVDGHIHLIPYRMLQYTIRDVVEQSIGTEACNQFFYDTGKDAGDVFFDGFMTEHKSLPLNEFVAELQRALKELGVGILRVEKAEPEKGEFVLTVSEDLDCSGLPDLGIEVCNYDEGFIAQIFFKYTGVVFTAKEVDCWCSGDRTCRFAVNRA